VSQFSRATVTTVTPVTTGSSSSDSPHQSGHFEPLRHTKHPHTPMDPCGHTSASAHPHPQTSPFDGLPVCLYGLECSLVPYCLTPFTTDLLHLPDSGHHASIMPLSTTSFAVGSSQDPCSCHQSFPCHLSTCCYHQ
jgi:hypothetical protein